MKAIITRAVCAILCVVFIMITAGCTDRVNETQSAETASETISTDKKDQLDAVLSNNSFKGIVQITKGGDAIYQYVDGNADDRCFHAHRLRIKAILRGVRHAALRAKEAQRRRHLGALFPRVSIRRQADDQKPSQYELRDQKPPGAGGSEILGRR